MSSSRPSCGLSISRAPVTARSIYHSLLQEPLSPEMLHQSRLFLQDQLHQAASLPNTLPAEPQALMRWMEQQAIDTGRAYSRYLKSRKAGEPRRYFTCRSHALSFLQGVAPTKLVDGAWLYGLLPRWNDPRLFPLVRTYLEELGDGEPAQNHVALYKRLLQEQDCDLDVELSDDHYTQGAIQLALAYHADAYLPEVLGYNLGYEQLPLHLLITAFELNELDIDPYYFTLHLTIDNASTGHARKAVQSVLNALPVAGDHRTFLRRVATGFRLNDLGLGTTAVIESFDLERELIKMLKRKSRFGRYVHSDFCSFAGRTVNEWLAKPGEIRQLLHILEERGWIRRHEDPRSSRFWRLIDEPGGQMFGVFSASEKQVLYDWIGGDWLHPPVETDPGTQGVAGRTTFRRRRSAAAGQRSLQNWQEAARDQADDAVRTLQRELDALPDDPKLQRLIDLMAPGRHDTAEGLLATRLYSARFG